MNMIFEDGVRLWLTGKIPFSELRSLPSAGFDMKGPDSILADAEKPLEIRPVDVRGIISEYVKYPSKPETVSLK